MTTLNHLINFYHLYEFLSYDDIINLSFITKYFRNTITNDHIIKNFIIPYMPQLFLADKDSIEFIRGPPSHSNIDITNHLKKNINKYNYDVNTYSIYIYIDNASSWCEDSKNKRCQFARGLYSRCDHINKLNPRLILSTNNNNNNVIKLKKLFNKLIEMYDDLKNLNYIQFNDFLSTFYLQNELEYNTIQCYF